LLRPVDRGVFAIHRLLQSVLKEEHSKERTGDKLQSFGAKWMESLATALHQEHEQARMANPQERSHSRRLLMPHGKLVLEQQSGNKDTLTVEAITRAEIDVVNACTAFCGLRDTRPKVAK